MNILITGVSGFIGTNLAEYLSKAYVVFGLDSKPHNISGIAKKITLDLTDYDKVKQFFIDFKEENKIDVIIHLISKLASRDTVKDLELLSYNIKITEGLLVLTELLKPKKIINFSSTAVYPNKNGLYNEISEVKPSLNSDCLYGLSKFCSENILDSMLKNKDIIISHLRISQVYGKGMRDDRIMPVMLKELKEKNSITVLGDGQRVSNFVKIDEVVEVVDFFIKSNNPGIYNVGGENISYLELAKRIIKDHGNDSSKVIKVLEGCKARFCIDASKINSARKTNQKNLLA